jgi:hypothetical protein
VEAAMRPQGPSFEQIAVGYLWLLETDSGRSFWFDDRGQRISLQVDRNLILVYTGMLRDFYEPTAQILEANILYPAIIADTRLPENPAGVKSLQARVADASQPHPQPVPPLPDTAGQISGKVYQLAENPAGWESVALTFNDGAEAQLIMRQGGQELLFPVGLDGLFRIPAEKEGLPDSFYNAMRGHWESKDTFVLEFENLYWPEKSSTRFTFKGDGLDLAAYSRVNGRLSIQGRSE